VAAAVLVQVRTRPDQESTTMARTPDAVALLKNDHRRVEDLFAAFEKARQASRKKTLATQICRDLTIHATIEEEIFYPACRDLVKDELLDEAYVEHDGAKVLIAEIAAGDPADAFFDAKVTVLAEMVRHHVKEEEKRAEGLFAQARQAGLDMDALAERLAARKEELRARIEAEGLPAPQTRSFSGHELVQGHPL
jgi:hemerythrin superfamily protein